MVQTKSKIPVVILAGGASRRMGQDKTLLPFQGYSTLIDYQVSRFSLDYEVYISLKHDKIFHSTHPCIYDTFDDYSSMGALASVLVALKNYEKIFVLGADTPFVPTQMPQWLDTTDKITIAQVAHKIHPTCAIYSTEYASWLLSLCEKKKYKITSFLQEAQAGYKFFDNPQWFTNLNTPEDYHQALELLQ